MVHNTNSLARNNSFQGMNLIKFDIPSNENKIRSFKTRIGGRNFSAIKITSRPGDPSFSSAFMKQIACHLSDIELDLDCFQSQHLRFSASILRELFYRMNMPTCCMEVNEMVELARQGEFNQAKKKLSLLKKAIAKFIC